MKKKVHISIVIPVYECKDCLLVLYSRLKESLEKIDKNFEIILVNDASPDGAWVIIKDLVDHDNRIIGINLSKNFGQHYAITAGLDFTNGEWIVVMDCDLQDQPEEIEKLYKKAQEGYDIVFGRRHNRKDNFIKKLFSKIFYAFLSYMTDSKQDGSIANFGIYNRKVIEVLKKMNEKLKYFPLMVMWTGFKSISINVVHADREIGKTSYNFKKMLNLAFDVIVAYSDKPLRLTIKLGFAITIISFIYAIFIFTRALLGIKGIEGWPSLIVSIWVLAGLIILILGILGIYIEKIFSEVKERPIYVISEVKWKKNSNK